MTTATTNADALIKEARRSHPSTRWLIYDQLARDFGEGFAAVVRRQVEESDRRHSERKRGNRAGGSDA